MKALFNTGVYRATEQQIIKSVLLFLSSHKQSTLFILEMDVTVDEIKFCTYLCVVFFYILSNFPCYCTVSFILLASFKRVAEKAFILQ